MLHIAGIERGSMIGKILCEYYPCLDDRAAVNVLDLAAGTGLVGADIHPLGFRNIDGVGKWIRPK